MAFFVGDFLLGFELDSNWGCASERTWERLALLLKDSRLALQQGCHLKQVICLAAQMDVHQAGLLVDPIQQGLA